jgi:RNA polymerase primary sigma factor
MEALAMQVSRRNGDIDELTALSDVQTQVLSAAEERELLRDLAECKAKLSQALKSIPGGSGDAEDPQSLADRLTAAAAKDGIQGARLGAIACRYKELRGKLALANTKLVAHVAKRFRERGIAYSDLLQEGMCGLLEAIDRFDLGRETKLATYATWWIRQAMQNAVASGAYPVRLSPRHLRQLAQNQDDGSFEIARNPTDSHVSADLIRRIHTATRPSLSLDANYDSHGDFNLLQTVSASADADPLDDVDTGETIGKLMGVLRPREQEVLSLRFGLGGQAGLSLSEVGKVLEVSKERIRQIQDRALEKLRAAAEEQDLTELLLTA